MRRLLAAVAVVAGTTVVPMAPASAGGGCHQPEVSEGTGTTVETRNVCFEPTVLRVPPGTTVTFVNRDGVPHSLTGVNLDGWDELGADVAVQHRFDAPGLYPYMCNLHPGMTGVVVVGDGRGAARTVNIGQPQLASARPAPLPSDDERSSTGVLLVATAVAAGAFGFVIGTRREKRASTGA